jgi:hypothetical protein
MAELDLSKYRGKTAEDDRRIIWALLKDHVRLTVDESDRVWTHRGVWIADVCQAASYEDSLKPLIEQSGKTPAN